MTEYKDGYLLNVLTELKEVLQKTEEKDGESTLALRRELDKHIALHTSLEKS